MPDILELSAKTSDIIKALQQTDTYDIINGGGRRLNLESIEQPKIKGFDPEKPMPQQISLKTDVVFSGYGAGYKFVASVTYSATVPADWNADTSIQEVQNFVEDTDFLITADNIRFSVHQTILPPLGGGRPSLSLVDLKQAGQIIAYKLHGQMPSKVGFDDLLVEEINFIIRQALVQLMIKRTGKLRTSIKETHKILIGMQQPIEVWVRYSSYYQLLTTTSNSTTYNALSTIGEPAHLKCVVKHILNYDAGYSLNIEALYSTPYPDGEPAIKTPRAIKKFLKKADLDCKVISVFFGSSHKERVGGSHEERVLDDDRFHKLGIAFDNEEALSIIESAINDPIVASHKTFRDAMIQIKELAKISIASDMRTPSISQLYIGW